MIRKALRNPEAFEVRERGGEPAGYGFQQDWYPTLWQRTSGCGPTAVSEILFYLERNRLHSGNSGLTKSEAVALMRGVWNSVTPTIHGIPSTDALSRGIRAYSAANRLGYVTESVEIPAKPSLRPELSTLLEFFADSLERDLPVAFLNLNSGTVRNLDSWHWVVAVSLEYEEDLSAAYITCPDEGMKKRIDFAEWFRTTSRGGGLVRISKQGMFSSEAGV